jgi:hypothetical protein
MTADVLCINSQSDKDYFLEVFRLSNKEENKSSVAFVSRKRNHGWKFLFSINVVYKYLTPPKIDDFSLQ